ncbi:MAG: PQQ-binding-like beta-propeller repeat protein [Firmicutes bacterium]|nr:PQQ-binding-like beta-propeller repeat protein [Bacillota bacterium]
MKRLLTGPVAVLASGMLLAACSSGTASNTPSQNQQQKAATPSTSTVDFSTFGYNYQQTREVPATQITKENVSQLGVAWSKDFRQLDSNVPGGQESFPIEANGVLYVTTGFDYVFAFDAKTGQQLWAWHPQQIGSFKNFGLNVNRGVAYGDGNVFLLTLDNHLVAIDAKSGKTVKDVPLSDAIPGATAEAGYYETAAPIFWNGLIFVGSSGGDNGARGFIMAYNAKDLSPAWSQPYWTVPPKGQDWLAKNKFQGGGAVWMPVTLDPQNGMLYAGIGNPAPDFYGADRPGANPNTDSVVALDAKTGKQVWVSQEISHDQWDYDAASSPMVLDATVNGQKQRVVVEGGKSGQWWAWDAKTGKKIYDGVPFVTIKHAPPTPEGTLEYPGALGGENYAPEAYDSTDNLVLIPGVEYPMLIKSAKDEAGVAAAAKSGIDFGTTMADPANIKPAGNYTAIDMNTGKVSYQVKVSEPMRGGFTTTTTGLAFYGGGDGKLYALDAKTGKELWSFQTGAPIAAAPTIYQLDGKEYVAIATGGTGTSSNGGKESQLFVFALGGSQVQMKAPNTTGAETGHGATTASNKAKEGSWIALGANSKTVDVLLIGSYNGVASGMNFDGYANGDMKITVPEGWTVNVLFKNASPQMPHSAMIAPENAKGKVQGVQPAFPNATTPDPVSGLAPNGAPQSFTFKADKAGTYLIWCAIPGHGTAGMWDTLVVDPSAKAPSITTPDHGTQQAK